MRSDMLSQTAGTDAPPELKRVLFVDDDEYLLDGLRDALRPYRRQWSMSFVTGGEAALAKLAEAPSAVIVSDLRMPGMDGATLLEIVRERYPAVVRIVLSGHAEMGMVARAAAAAHRMIAKPCETDDLAKVIERGCALHELAARAERPRAIGASSLPSAPGSYAELTELLSAGQAAAADVARVVERDIAMAAKFLQLANSAYFGRRSAVTRVDEAINYLGLDALRALVLEAEAFGELPVDGFDLEALHRHSRRVARLAAAIASDTGAGEGAFASGLLHDVGLLVLAAQDPEELAADLAAAREQGRPLHEIERERRGVSHADVGAHVLALWGVPDTIAEAVSGHHDGQVLELPLDGAGVTYLATRLVEELEAEDGEAGLPVPELDLELIERAGLAGRLEDWRELAARQFLEGAD